MKGYVYITGQGADPGLRDNLNDPIFSRVPTLGACMPNIRRFVERGDWIFVVSGKTPQVQQYVVGGLRVAEKIDALAAYRRFPQNRLAVGEDGSKSGNIICNENGEQDPLDDHSQDTFERRLENYIVGDQSVVLTTEQQVQRGREQTLGKLSEILQRPRRNRVIDVMGRMSKLSEPQVRDMLDWLEGIRADAR